MRTVSTSQVRSSPIPGPVHPSMPVNPKALVSVTASNPSPSRGNGVTHHRAKRSGGHTQTRRTHRSIVPSKEVVDCNRRLQRGSMHELSHVEPGARIHRLRRQVRETPREAIGRWLFEDEVDVTVVRAWWGLRRDIRCHGVRYGVIVWHQKRGVLLFRAVGYQVWLIPVEDHGLRCGAGEHAIRIDHQEHVTCMAVELMTADLWDVFCVC